MYYYNLIYSHVYDTLLYSKELREIQVGSLIFNRVLSRSIEFILFTDFSNIYRSHLSDVVYSHHIL